LDALKAPGSDEFELSMESAKSLGMLLDAGKSSFDDFDKKLESLGEQVKLVSSAGRLVRGTDGYADRLKSVISEVEDMYSRLQASSEVDGDKRGSYEEVLEAHYSTLNQLMEQKMNKNKTISEADVTLKLTGLPDEAVDSLDDWGVELITGGEEEAASEEEPEAAGEEEAEEGDEEELDLDLGDEEEADEAGEEEEKMESKNLSDDLVVEIDEGMLRKEISRMKALREAADMPKNAVKGAGAGEVADDFEDEDLGDPFVDVELTTEGEDEDKKADKKEELDELDELKMDELDELSMDEDGKKVDELDELELEGEHNQATDHSNDDPQTNKQNRMPESLRRRIAAETALQTEAKKKAQSAKKKQVEAQKKMKQAKKMQEKEQAKKQAKKMQEVYEFYATKFNESVARSNKLKGMLSEATRDGHTLNGETARSAAETDNLRNKLAETNLFNAKLLFTNKVLQNESLTKRQKAEVIERLDEAANEREVKLVYESLVKALRGAPATKMTESVERGVIGSSSRPARPASTNSLNEGFEADRWARLAGIVK
jgi:hypothetical protein